MVASTRLAKAVIRPPENGNALVLAVQLKAPPPSGIDFPLSGGECSEYEVTLCRAYDDPDWIPAFYDGNAIKHDNFAMCDANHHHVFGCQMNHKIPVGFWFVVECWLLVGIWLAVNHKTQKG